MNHPPVSAVLLAAAALLLQPIAGRTDALAQQRQSSSTDGPGRALSSFEWRSIGPAQIGGRFVDIAADPTNPYVVYIAHSTGGVFRTDNSGVTWEPLFQQEGTTAVGAVAVSPSNPDIVWVGTGEGNNTNSWTWGKGVFKSVDRGATWRNMGLRGSHNIPAGCIVVHPANPDVVYVCAMGRLWGEGGERGLYRTTDGGESWQRLLHVNDRTGVTHMVMDPSNPDVIYAATHERVRTRWQATGSGPGSGIYKTVDGGATWTELTNSGNGLPGGSLMGRIGLAIYPRDPRIVMAVIESQDDGSLPAHSSGRYRFSPSAGVFRTEDGGSSWERVNDIAPYWYYGKIRINPQDDQDVWVLGVYLKRSRDGGRTFDMDVTERAARWVHGDHHAMWINPADPRHIVMGSDGGVYFSFDGGHRWEYNNTIAAGQFYEVSYDYRVPYRVCGGTQDNGTWCGPSDVRQYWGVTNQDWYWVHGADGFYTQSDPVEPWRLYVGIQWGNYERLDMRDWSKHGIQPQAVSGGPTNGQSFCFDFNTPIQLSRHDRSRLYYGSQYLIRMSDFGDRWSIISPDLTRGPVRAAADACPSITTIAESPLQAEVVWAGTADGHVQVTRDGGDTWSNVTRNLPGGSARWNGFVVSGLAASRHAPGTAYVALDGLRSDDYAPHLFVTRNYGASWTSISRGLPDDGSIKVVREDHRNPNLLFVGTEFGVFVSLDAGRSWQQFNNNLPHVPVYDLQIHDRDNDLIAATFGRSIWITNIAPLQELTPDALASAAHLFDVPTAWIHNVPRMFDIVGHKFFHSPRLPYGSVISYHLREAGGQHAEIFIRDATGAVVRTLTGPAEAGLNRVQWDLRRDEARPRRPEDPRRLAAGDSPGPGGVGRVPQAGNLMEVLPGTYTVTLRVGGVELSRPMLVRRMTADQEGSPWHVEGAPFEAQGGTP